MAYINHQRCEKCDAVTQHCNHECIRCRDKIPDNRCQICSSAFHSTDSHINFHGIQTAEETIARLKQQLEQMRAENQEMRKALSGAAKWIEMYLMSEGLELTDRKIIAHHNALKKWETATLSTLQKKASE